MTEKDLITKIQQLKHIKPTSTWVSLSKENILQSGSIMQKKQAVKIASNWNFQRIFSAASQRKLAYSLAVLFFVFTGVIGVLKYQGFGQPSTVLVKSQADIIVDEKMVKSNVEDFKLKSQNLVDAVNTKSQNSEVARKEVKAAANKLANELQKNPKLAKVIALDVNNNNSLLNIPGGNDVAEVTDMYRAIVVPLIDDLKERTLTKDQEAELQRIETNFNNKGEALTALRDILLMNASQDSKGN